jgi:hypothetical protein
MNNYNCISGEFSSFILQPSSGTLQAVTSFVVIDIMVVMGE